MFFNSIDFAIFLPIVFICYWFIVNKNLKFQNFFIVVVSYIFYAWWDWRFLFLIMFSTIVDYFVGYKLGEENNKTKRKVLLWISVLVNLGFLGFFKYFNFFLNNFISAFSFLGYSINLQGLNIILPVGISFYTFQTLSYSVDVYRRKFKPTKDFIAFAAFVSFFPQLVAGPIERATHLLPQFYKKRIFEYNKAVDGLRQILWGLFKKIVIADNAAEIVNQIFNGQLNYSGSTLLLGILFFSFQIYGDFSGYSDIAIGLSRLFGFDLMQNFNFPYFSRDIAEFWRRWHISLSTWFRDYLYIPLGGSRGKTSKTIRNIFIIFIVSGFWHGANWTFIVWGALNAIYFLPLFLFGKNKINIDIVAKGKIFPSIKEFLSMIITFILVSLSWIFFRAKNIKYALHYLTIIFSKSFFTIPYFTNKRLALATFYLIIIFIVIEWLGREKQFAIADLSLNRFFRWSFYILIILVIYFFGNFSENIEFIYFQF